MGQRKRRTFTPMCSSTLPPLLLLQMNQPPGAKVYSGFVDCAVKIVRAEGPAGLWAGFLPIWARFAPTTSTQLVVFGIIKEYFKIEGGEG